MKLYWYLSVTSLRFLRAFGWSVIYWWPLSVQQSIQYVNLTWKPEELRKLKIGRKEVRDTVDSWPHLEVKRSNTCGGAEFRCCTACVFYRDVNVQCSISILWVPSWKLWVTVQVTTCRGRGPTTGRTALAVFWILCTVFITFYSSYCMHIILLHFVLCTCSCTLFVTVFCVIPYTPCACNYIVIIIVRICCVFLCFILPDVANKRVQ